MDLRRELHRMGVSDDVIATAKIHGKPLADYEGTSKRSDAWAPFRSKWEALYAMELVAQKRAGTILDWQYETIRLKTEDARITEDGVKKPASWYKPDFLVWFSDGSFVFIEVKGYQRPKDMKQYELARIRFPQFEFRMITRTEGRWEIIR